MAYADYRLCDICGGKAFYDANLNYEFGTHKEPIPVEELVENTNYGIDRLGDWAVICLDCANTHKCVIVKK